MQIVPGGQQIRLRIDKMLVGIRIWSNLQENRDVRVRG